MSCWVPWQEEAAEINQLPSHKVQLREGFGWPPRPFTVRRDPVYSLQGTLFGVLSLNSELHSHVGTPHRPCRPPLSPQPPLCGPWPAAAWPSCSAPPALARGAGPAARSLRAVRWCPPVCLFFLGKHGSKERTLHPKPYIQLPPPPKRHTSALQMVHVSTWEKAFEEISAPQKPNYN